jgi:hypothetical protein
MRQIEVLAIGPALGWPVPPRTELGAMPKRGCERDSERHPIDVLSLFGRKASRDARSEPPFFVATGALSRLHQQYRDWRQHADLEAEATPAMRGLCRIESRRSQQYQVALLFTGEAHRLHDTMTENDHRPVRHLLGRKCLAELLHVLLGGLLQVIIERSLFLARQTGNRIRA